MSDPTVMAAMVPLTVTNRSGGSLVVKVGDAEDKTVDPGATTDTHSTAATLDMIDSVKAEAQAKIGSGG